MSREQAVPGHERRAPSPRRRADDVRVQRVAAHHDAVVGDARQGSLDELINFREGFPEEANCADAAIGQKVAIVPRSEEHTSELQSLMRISYAVFCLKKKKNISRHQSIPKLQH